MFIAILRFINITTDVGAQNCMSSDSLDIESKTQSISNILLTLQSTVSSYVIVLTNLLCGKIDYRRFS